MVWEVEPHRQLLLTTELLGQSLAVSEDILSVIVKGGNVWDSMTVLSVKGGMCEILWMVSNREKNRGNVWDGMSSEGLKWTPWIVLGGWRISVLCNGKGRMCEKGWVRYYGELLGQCLAIGEHQLSVITKWVKVCSGENKFKCWQSNRKQASKNWVDMFDHNHWLRNIIGTQATTIKRNVSTGLSMISQAWPYGSVALTIALT